MENKPKLGVIVGRFQTPDLHEGHRYLIEMAMAKCQKLFIVLGTGGGWADSKNPMDFATRAAMFKTAYPEVVVAEIKDHPSDETWSKQLDHLITQNFPGYEVTLFGSRECFLPFYTGQFPAEQIVPRVKVASTPLREAAARTALGTKDFRSGVIYAGTTQNFPTSFQVVDIAIRHSLEAKVLVGRKAGEEAWRFPGGFVDPTDQSLEQAAKREAREEVGDIEIGDVRYVTSVRIDDYRYRQSEHKMLTAFFSAIYVFGPIRAGDDLAEVRWQAIDGLLECLVPEHKALGQAFLENIVAHT